jgi:DNA-binding transcriptional LysR family regulator
LAAVDEQLPGLEVEPVEESLDGVEAGLREGRFELAVTYDLGLGAGFDCERLLAVQPYALLPADHRLRSEDAVRLADLADEPFVLLDLPHSRDYFTAAFTAAGVTPSIRYRTRSAETARALVGRGLGWSLLNLRPAADQSVEGRQVVARPLADPVPALSVVLAKAMGFRPTRRAEALAELARGVLTPKMIRVDGS